MAHQLNDGRLKRAISAVAVFTLVALATGSALAGDPPEPVTGQNVAKRIAAAKTAADHHALAAYFRTQATAEADQVALHERMLKSYRKISGTPYARMKEHCGNLIRSHGQAKAQYEELAEEHAAIANSLASEK